MVGDGKNALCLLCTDKSSARVNLTHSRNAGAHLKARHSEAFSSPSGIAPFKYPQDTANHVDVMLQRPAAKRQYGSTEEQSRASALVRAAQATEEQSEDGSSKGLR